MSRKSTLARKKYGQTFQIKGDRRENSGQKRKSMFVRDQPAPHHQHTPAGVTSAKQDMKAMFPGMKPSTIGRRYSCLMQKLSK